MNKFLFLEDIDHHEAADGQLFLFNVCGEMKKAGIGEGRKKRKERKRGKRRKRDREREEKVRIRWEEE